MQHGAKFLKRLPRLPKRCHQINQGGFRFSPPKNSGGLDRWEGRFQRDEHCPWMGQLAGFSMSESHAAAGGHLASTERQTIKQTNKQKERRSYEQSKRASIQARRQELNSRRN